MKIVKTVMLLVLVINCAVLFAQFGQNNLEVAVGAELSAGEVDISSIGPELPEGDEPVIVAEAEFKTGAKAGGKAELTVMFGVTEHFHFYHKNNAERGYSMPIGFLWPELNGLKLIETVWPKPYEHVEDAKEDWVELELSHGAEFTFIFEVPTDAAGKDLNLTGGFKAQVCDINGCHDREGEFAATLKVLDPRGAVDSHGFYLNFEYAMEQAKKQDKQLLVDFNGKNCPPCRKMEKYVFTVPEVHELMKNFVVVSIQNDLKENESNYKVYNELWAKYRPSKRAPVPYYVVMNHEGKVLRGIGSTLPSDPKLPKDAEAHKFIDFLEGKSGIIAPNDTKPEEKEDKVKLPKDWPKGLHAPIYPAIEDGFDFEAKFNADKVKPGATVAVELHFKLKEGVGPYNLYHKDTVHGIPLIIAIKGQNNLKLNGDWRYPKPKKYMEDWGDGQGEQPLLKLYGHVVLVQNVKIPDDAKIGDTVSIWGTVSGQFCDSKGCISFNQKDPENFMRQFGFHATTIIAADGVSNKTSDVSAPSDSEDNPLWFLLVAFLAGMVTLLTPCVLPVLPLTIGFFVSQSAKGKSPFFTALIYCACIVGTFTFFGLMTSILMGATGAQNISTNGYVNIFLGVLFAIFALSFLGMFELAMPRFLTSWFNKKQMGATKEGNGYAKAFFSGSAFALISFSCTGPVAGAFLAGAAGGDLLLPTMAMFVFSMGMALPIFILGQFPALMKKMPKSGGWMNALKVVFGFVEIGLAAMYFSQAEQAFGSMAAAEWVNRFIVIAIWASCSFAIAAYLFGLFRMPHDHDETKQIGVLRAMFAIGFFAFAIYMIPGMFGAKYGQYLEGILPLTPKSGGIELGFGGGKGKRNDVHDLPWDKNFERGMIKAKAANRPVFVDFTGYN